MVAALVFSAFSLTMLYTFAHFAGGVTLPPVLALTILGKLLLGCVPLIALGFMIGFLINPTAARNRKALWTKEGGLNRERQPLQGIDA